MDRERPGLCGLIAILVGMRRKRMEVAARNVGHFDGLKNPGDFILTGTTGVEGSTGMIFVCPCGCGDRSPVKFGANGGSGVVDARWAWNGDRDKPTLTPSLNKVAGCKWHGYLTDGVFRSC